MDFGLSEDQRLRQETVSRFVTNRYSLFLHPEFSLCHLPLPLGFF